MKHVLINHHIQGMLFYDKQKKRRYFVTKQNVTVNTVPIEEPIEYFYDLSEEAYFQQSIMRDDLDELIYMAKTYIDGIQIMEIRVVNNNPMNFKALINGSLELSIHYEDGVRAMPGLPNVELLDQYWKGGVHQSASANEAKVREILMATPKVNAKKIKPHNGAT
ncbi:hypothetical protein GFB57_18150 [Citrobacter sp. S39]|uniref:hypothetical protein n=1 Tax=Citrobacter TaxID=544 RepID=UPI0010CA13AE|nr:MULTISPECIES: hypothetical protein [Citrobacter]MDX7507785.1 hypothetical protein [Citrobacter freundii]QFX90406.1 hypothetical protein GFB57_18150 [Citrobacter sp. S39]TKV15350.1 hypothetical protein FDX04_08640 [Citrobacter sp. wls615]